jgi:hypothetical protein
MEGLKNPPKLLYVIYGGPLGKMISSTLIGAAILRARINFSILSQLCGR